MWVDSVSIFANYIGTSLYIVGSRLKTITSLSIACGPCRVLSIAEVSICCIRKYYAVNAFDGSPTNNHCASAFVSQLPDYGRLRLHKYGEGSFLSFPVILSSKAYGNSSRTIVHTTDNAFGVNSCNLLVSYFVGKLTSAVGSNQSLSCLAKNYVNIRSGEVGLIRFYRYFINFGTAYSTTCNQFLYSINFFNLRCARFMFSTSLIVINGSEISKCLLSSVSLICVCVIVGCCQSNSSRIASCRLFSNFYNLNSNVFSSQVNLMSIADAAICVNTSFNIIILLNYRTCCTFNSRYA